MTPEKKYTLPLNEAQLRLLNKNEDIRKQIDIADLLLLLKRQLYENELMAEKLAKVFPNAFSANLLPECSLCEYLIQVIDKYEPYITEWLFDYDSVVSPKDIVNKYPTIKALIK